MENNKYGEIIKGWLFKILEKLKNVLLLRVTFPSKLKNKIYNMVDFLIKTTNFFI